MLCSKNLTVRCKNLTLLLHQSSGATRSRSAAVAAAAPERASNAKLCCVGSLCVLVPHIRMHSFARTFGSRSVTCKAAFQSDTEAVHSCRLTLPTVLLIVAVPAMMPLEGQCSKQRNAPVDPMAGIHGRAELKHHDEICAVPCGCQCACPCECLVYWALVDAFCRFDSLLLWLQPHHRHLGKEFLGAALSCSTNRTAQSKQWKQRSCPAQQLHPARATCSSASMPL